MKVIPDDRIVRLWDHLTRQFNVAVQSIGTDLDENQQVCARVTINKKGAPDIKTLPDKFEGETVRYDLADRLPSPYNF